MPALSRHYGLHTMVERRLAANSSEPLTVTVMRLRPSLAEALTTCGLNVAEIEPGRDEPGPQNCILFGNELVIVWKNAHEFVQSIVDKSLFAEAAELTEGYEKVVFVVEGKDLYDVRNVHEKAIQGALSALVVQYQAAVLRTASQAETVGIIATIARHQLLGVPEVSMHPKRKAVDLADLQRRVVEMLPCVGRVGARNMLRAFESIDRICNASEEELAAVPGIGARGAAQIRQVLSGAYESVDTETEIEEAVSRNLSLLFGGDVELVARQRAVAVPTGRGIIDLAVADRSRKVLYIVELKKDPPTKKDVAQVRGYIDSLRRNAAGDDAHVLSEFAAGGFEIRGVIASPFEPKHAVAAGEIEVRVLPREKLAEAVTAHYHRERTLREVNKILSPEPLRAALDERKAASETVVWTNGCFDILHKGHVTYLEHARSLGDCLVVGVNSDASTRAIKGPDRPIFPEDHRARLVAALRCVDYVTIFDETDTTRLLELLEPTVYAKGGDYTIDTINQDERRVVEAYGGRIAILPKIEGESTTAVIQRIKER